MKVKESRFQVHDELTAPERSVPILKGALAGGGQLPNFIGVLAGSPAVLRAYARFRSELRNGALPYVTQQRIALAVAEHQQSEYALSTLLRTARDAGLGLDEIALAREFDSRDDRESIPDRVEQRRLRAVLAEKHVVRRRLDRRQLIAPHRRHHIIGRKRTDAKRQRRVERFDRRRGGAEERQRCGQEEYRRVRPGGAVVIWTPY